MKAEIGVVDSGNSLISDYKFSKNREGASEEMRKE
jgi:hypothetical protein